MVNLLISVPVGQCLFTGTVPVPVIRHFQSIKQQKCQPMFVANIHSTTLFYKESIGLQENVHLCLKKKEISVLLGTPWRLVNQREDVETKYIRKNHPKTVNIFRNYQNCSCTHPTGKDPKSQPALRCHTVLTLGEVPNPHVDDMTSRT